MKKQHTDFVIIGAGILGLAFAYRLNQTYPDARIVLLEKEKAIGLHASGRNSGVLHSGIYYKENTLKAKLCVKGARLMRRFCEEHNLVCKKIGKVILPTEADHDQGVDILYQRGISNGVSAEIIDDQQLKTIEPEARTASKRALYLPNTSVVNSQQVLAKFLELLAKPNIAILYQAKLKCINSEQKLLITNLGEISYKNYLINTAGTFADKIATMAGIEHDYVMLPFRGNYFKLVGPVANNIHHLIYPVPNLAMPFLGVHTTSSPDGNVYLGPTAMPSLGRENYFGLKNFNFIDTLSSLKNISKMYVKNSQGMRQHMHFESQTLLLKKHLLARAKKLVPNLRLEHIINCDKRGIRAQLFDKKQQQLEMDFVFKQTDQQLHILNAISPAFTSSLSMVDYLLKKIK